MRSQLKLKVEDSTRTDRCTLVTQETMASWLAVILGAGEDKEGLMKHIRR